MAGDVFTAAYCAVDAACDGRWANLTRSVVQLTQPVFGNFCSGTLVRGRDGSVLVLTARHCVASVDPSFVYPWSTYGVLLDYSLPCNASSVDYNAGNPFDKFLQGLAVVFVDFETDIAVLKVLQDVPPAWNVTFAGVVSGGVPVGPCASTGRWGWVGLDYVDTGDRQPRRHRARWCCVLGMVSAVWMTHRCTTASALPPTRSTGWDARVIAPSFPYVDVSQPSGDTAKISFGE